MRYRNPVIAEADHEAGFRAERREFGRLLLTVTVLLLALVFALDRLAVWVAPRLPFSWEQEVAHTLHMDTLPAVALGGAHATDAQRQQQIEAALQQRLNRIAQAVDLPADMSVTAHYVDSPTVNAVATLGGHITVFSGLLQKMEYEEELDAVLAHELGHVQHRDMVRQLSRGLSMAAALNLVGIRSSTLNRWLLGDLQQLGQLAYSREAERQADATAALAAQRLYGHTGGLERLFQRFEEIQKEHGGAANEWTAFLQSHPLPQERARTAHGAGAAPRLTPLDPLYKQERKPRQP